MTNLWSGRFDTAPDAAAFEFGASFRVDRRLFEDDVTGSIAWARALRGAGVLDADEARRIEETLVSLLDEARSNPAFVSGDDEDVHSFVERQLVERLGDAGRRLHTGRSRNEQVSLDLRLYLRRRIPLLQRAVAAVVDALAAQAASAGDALMPSFTHFRPAQPVLVAHFFLSHVAPLRRDFARLAAAREEADALPLGSGAIAGTAYAVDVDALANDLASPRSRQQHGRLVRSRFRCDLPLCLRHDDGAPLSAGGGPHHPRRMAPLLRAVGRAQHQAAYDAAEKEPARSSSSAGSRPCHWPPRGYADDDRGGRPVTTRIRRRLEAVFGAGGRWPVACGCEVGLAAA
jgi:hypothetical protein